MSRYPYSYSTFPNVNEKAKRKSAKNGKTVSTLIHDFLIDYVKDEPELPDKVGPNNQATVAAPTIGNGPSESGPADDLTVIAEKPEPGAASLGLATEEEPAPVEPEKEEIITQVARKEKPKKKAATKKATRTAKGKQTPSTNKRAGTTWLSKKGKPAKAQPKTVGRK